MISIQDLGREILTNSPRNFYVWAGTEYGIKEKYLEILEAHYGSRIESASVHSILNMMHTKRLIPLKPSLYVVRYDDEFVASLDDHIQSLIENTNIVGTIVCIYESEKQYNKLEKYLPNYTTHIDLVNPKFIKKYLSSDFMQLPETAIQSIVSCSDNYSQARNMCRCISYASSTSQNSLSDVDIRLLFGKSNDSSDAEIRSGVASRNFRYLIQVLEHHPDEIDSMLYSILSTMIELDRLLDSSYVQSDLRNYLKCWTRQDVYNMFVHTYNEILRLRSLSCDPVNSIIYLFSLLNFASIPSPEVI